MTLNKTLSMLLLLGILAPFHAVAQDAVAELNPEDVLARVHFDPATYELYRPWADKWFKELAKPVAPHERPRVDGDYLVNPADALPVDWIRAILSASAVPSEGDREFVLHVLMPSDRAYDRDFYSRIVEKLFLNVFYERHGFAEEKFQAKQDEVNRIVSEYNQAVQKMQDELRSHDLQLQVDRREVSDETLRSRLAAIEDGPKLELEMNLAEMQARREAILRVSANRIVALTKATEEREALEDEHRIIQQKLASLRAKFELGTLSEFDLKLQTAEAEKSLADLHEKISGLNEKAANVAEEYLSERAKQMLIEAEVNLAGLEARRNVLLTQFDEVKARLAKRVELQLSIDKLDARIKELQAKVQETWQSLNSDEYRTSRPEIEWVPEQEKPAQ